MFPRILVVGFLVLCWAAPARADDAASARAHYLKAAAAFDAGRYAEAALEFTATYHFRPDAALLYDIAQSHRLAGHRQEALIAYRWYLAKVPDADNRAECEKWIAQLSKPLGAGPSPAPAPKQ
jgi:hypothetical protein